MTTRTLIATVSVALLAAPSLALADPPAGPGHGAKGHPHQRGTAQADPPGPNAPHANKAKAYGVYCQGQSKKHVHGQRGTPFSQCVTAMAKLATGKASNPAQACATMSKKHVAGQSGTPYGKCVAAAAKLQGEAG